MSKGIVLLSGGMDSLVCAAIAVKECKETYFLHVSYGQRTEDRELLAFQRICNHYQPQGQLICNIDCLQKIGGSSLIDKNAELAIPVKKGTVPDTYVPFRNAMMLSLAVSWAETLKADCIYIGAVEEDGAGYPDCRQLFYQAFNRIIEFGTKNEKKLEVLTPLIHKGKMDIVLLGKELNVPFDLSWSCYEKSEKACGSCASCVIRLKAFRDANVTDPLSYE